jgi:hypothetical protein
MTVNQMVKAGYTSLYGSKPKESHIINRSAKTGMSSSIDSAPVGPESEYTLSEEWKQKITEFAKSVVARGTNRNSTEYNEPRNTDELLRNLTEQFANATGANWTDYTKLSYDQRIAKAKAVKAEQKANGTFGTFVHKEADPKIKAMREFYYDALYSEINARGMAYCDSNGHDVAKEHLYDVKA